MKLSLLSLALVVLAGIPHLANAAEGKHAAPDPVIKAVAFHSDNCGACKILGPKMKQAMGAVNMEKIDVVKFNFTDAASIEETKALAVKKGVNDVLTKFGAKTGFVALVNGKGEITDKLNASDSVADIAAKLARAIASAS